MQNMSDSQKYVFQNRNVNYFLFIFALMTDTYCVV